MTDIADIATQRAAVVAEARSWIKTPFHDCAGIKGVGTDCAHLPYKVYQACGIVPAIDIPSYTPQFMMHSSVERFLAIVLPHAVEVPYPTGPGDLVLWQFGRSFSHGAIILDWPRIIHAHSKAGGVIEDDAERNAMLVRDHRGHARARKFFTPRAWQVAA